MSLTEILLLVIAIFSALSFVTLVLVARGLDDAHSRLTWIERNTKKVIKGFKK